MPFFPRSRQPRPGQEALLGWKLTAFFIGAVLWIIGAAIRSDLLTAIAIIVLLSGLLSSLFRPRRDEVEDDVEDERHPEQEER